MLLTSAGAVRPKGGLSETSHTDRRALTFPTADYEAERIIIERNKCSRASRRVKLSKTRRRGNQTRQCRVADGRLALGSATAMMKLQPRHAEPTAGLNDVPSDLAFIDRAYSSVDA